MIAWEDQGRIDLRAALDVLDQLAQTAAAPVAAAADLHGRIHALNHVLFTQQGFYGDPQCYDRPDPANSYLDQVLARRTGLPIMLALIYVEVGRRLGLPLYGLALPGHFLVRCANPGEDVYIDPFRAGALWSSAECMQQIASFYGTVTPELFAMLLRPPAAGAMLARILRNLKQTHLAQENVGGALIAVERLLLLDQSDAGELRDRGLLRLRAGRIYPALIDLETYARRSPAAADIDQIRRFVRDLMTAAAPRN